MFTAYAALKGETSADAQHAVVDDALPLETLFSEPMMRNANRTPPGDPVDSLFGVTTPGFPENDAMHREVLAPYPMGTWLARATTRVLTAGE